MYLEHFGLTRSPFKITPDTTLFYEGGNRGAALEAVKYAILQGEGIIKVVGEVGSGKTMLCRMLEVKLPDYVEIVYLANPSLSPEKILHVIAAEMKLPVSDSDDKSAVMHKIQEYLLDRHAKGRQVVVFIEEAQGMPLETLEEIRLLSNLETNEYKLLQIVLFGQPELDEKLSRREIRQLKERITHHFSLDMFKREDIQSYLNFRLRVAGYKEADLFNSRHAALVARYSLGLTRRINILADKALLAAFAENSDEIRPKHIKLAAKDSQYAGSALSPWWRYGAVVLVIVMLVSAGWFMRDMKERNPLAQNSKVNSQESDASIENKSSSLPAVSGESVDQRLKSKSKSQLLSSRLDDTLDWLKNREQVRYSIQLMLIDETRLDALEQFLSRIKGLGLIEQTYVYQVSKKGQLYYGVVYGGYRQYSNALESMKNISSQLRLKGLFIRAVDDITSDYT